jgi:hypothetical protein
MAAFANFLRDMLGEGRLVLSAAPNARQDRMAGAVLAKAWESYSLGLAGPLLTLDEEVATAAGRLMQLAAWYYLNPGFTVKTPEKLFRMPMKPASPQHHASADLVLRHLPALYRRTHALMPTDVLPQMLRETLLEWPLSGVLSDIADAPATAPDFGNHAGVNFLYAERLARHERSTWFPSGLGMQYVELVWHESGRDTELLPALAGGPAKDVED